MMYLLTSPERSMSRSAENLAETFVSNSQAQTCRSSFAAVAEKMVHERITGLSEPTAAGGKVHAWQLRACLLRPNVKGGRKGPRTELPVGCVITETDPSSVLAGGDRPHTCMYRQHAGPAEVEGSEGMAPRVRAISEAGMHYDERCMSPLGRMRRASRSRRQCCLAWSAACAVTCLRATSCRRGAVLRAPPARSIRESVRDTRRRTDDKA